MRMFFINVFDFETLTTKKHKYVTHEFQSFLKFTYDTFEKLMQVRSLKYIWQQSTRSSG